MPEPTPYLHAANTAFHKAVGNRPSQQGRATPNAPRLTTWARSCPARTFRTGLRERPDSNGALARRTPSTYRNTPRERGDGGVSASEGGQPRMSRARLRRPGGSVDRSSWSGSGAGWGGVGRALAGRSAATRAPGRWPVAGGWRLAVGGWRSGGRGPCSQRERQSRDGLRLQTRTRTRTAAGTRPPAWGEGTRARGAYAPRRRPPIGPEPQPQPRRHRTGRWYDSWYRSAGITTSAVSTGRPEA